MFIYNTYLLICQVLFPLEPLTCNWSCKLLILISMLYLSMFVMFVFLQIVAHGMLINPVLGNHGAGSAVLTMANLYIHRFVSACRAAVCLVINIGFKSGTFFFKKEKN